LPATTKIYAVFIRFKKDPELHNIQNILQMIGHKRMRRAGCVVQMVEDPPKQHEALSSNPGTAKRKKSMREGGKKKYEKNSKLHGKSSQPSQQTLTLH
jgi:hypothetical protein